MESKKRFSVITIFIIVLVICAIIFACIKFFVLDRNRNENTGNTGAIADILGEENVEYDGNKKINISEYIQGEMYLEDFTFSNVYVYSIDGVTRIEFDVCNDSSSRKKLGDYKIKIYSEKGEAGEIVCTGEEFAAGQTKKLSVVIEADVANLTTIEIDSVYSANF